MAVCVHPSGNGGCGQQRMGAGRARVRWHLGAGWGGKPAGVVGGGCGEVSHVLPSKNTVRTTRATNQPWAGL